LLFAIFLLPLFVLDSVIQVSEVKEILTSTAKLGPIHEMTLVCNGKILEDSSTLNNVKSTDTIFVALSSQPPSWKPSSNEASLAVPSGPTRPVIRARNSQEDDPLMEQIKELELAICMLERSIEELKCAGPDPDFDEAIEENIVAIARSLLVSRYRTLHKSRLLMTAGSAPKWRSCINFARRAARMDRSRTPRAAVPPQPKPAPAPAAAPPPRRRRQPPAPVRRRQAAEAPRTAASFSEGAAAAGGGGGGSVRLREVERLRL
jgi:hypothetical protein